MARRRAGVWSTSYTPIQFVQMRTGFRWNDGIPQDHSEHQRLYFVELHGFSDPPTRECRKNRRWIKPKPPSGALTSKAALRARAEARWNGMPRTRVDAPRHRGGRCSRFWFATRIFCASIKSSWSAASPIRRSPPCKSPRCCAKPATRCRFFDAMLAEGLTNTNARSAPLSRKWCCFYEDTFNFLSKMCLGRNAPGCLPDDRLCSSRRRQGDRGRTRTSPTPRDVYLAGGRGCRLAR